MPYNNLDTDFWLLFGILAVIILFGLLVALCIFINDFSRELKYLNSEIERSNGAERKRWLRKRRKLWLSLIPFVKR